MSERLLFGFVTRARKGPWPEKPSAQHRHEIGKVIVNDVLLSDSPSWGLVYYLTDELRTLPTDPSLLSRRADLGLEDDNHLSPKYHWYPGFWLAQYIADGIAEAWEAEGRPAEDLQFIFDFMDDGPNRTYMTLDLQVRNIPALEAWLKESGMTDEERESLI